MQNEYTWEILIGMVVCFFIYFFFSKDGFDSETKKLNSSLKKNDTQKAKKNNIDNLNVRGKALNNLIKNFSPHLDELSNESDEMIHNIFTICGVASEHLEKQLLDSGSPSQPLLVKLDKYVYNKRLDHLYSRGYVYSSCVIIGHPKENLYLCLDKKPGSERDKNILFTYMMIITHLKMFGPKGLSILEKSHIDSEASKPMFDKGSSDCLLDLKEYLEGNNEPKRLFNYLMKKK